MMANAAYEFIRDRARHAPSDMVVGRLAHHAVAALLNDQLPVTEFRKLVTQFTGTGLLLEHPGGHIDRTGFTLGSIVVESDPVRVTLPAPGEPDGQFTFTVDEAGQPQFGIYASNTCI